MTARELQNQLQSAKPPRLLRVLPAEVFAAARIPDSQNACIYETVFLDQVKALGLDAWKQTAIAAALESREADFGKLVTASQMEQWQVNVAVHYNAWDNLTKPDFAPVAEAFSALVTGFTCPQCNGYLYVLPNREDPESLRCDCGATNLNLVKKRS